MYRQQLFFFLLIYSRYCLWCVYGCGGMCWKLFREFMGHKVGTPRLGCQSIAQAHAHLPTLWKNWKCQADDSASLCKNFGGNQSTQIRPSTGRRSKLHTHMHTHTLRPEVRGIYSANH